MAQESLTGKIAVITGGARGIGFAIAEHLLAGGAKVAFCALRQESVDAAVASLSPKGDVLGFAADVSRLDDVRRFIDQILSTFRAIDILINNAGVRTYKPVADLDPAEFDRMIAVNLSGPCYLIHQVLPVMKRQGGGDIINISSLSSTTPFAGGAGTDFSGHADWKVAPDDIAEAVLMLLRMPRRTTVSRIDVKPSRPPRPSV